MRTCLACSTTTPESSGRFCPECGALLVATTGFDRAGGADPAAETQPGSQEPVSTLVGATIDGFHVDGIIGGGAFGGVYRAVQTGLDRPVALKVPTMEIAADPVMARRFEREARSAARVQHPGVVSIYAVGNLPDGRPYLAMQLLDGEPLDAILRDGAVPVVRALGIARQIASALAETHAAGVVHRDLKPSNVMWRRDRNGDDLITLVDFGIAVCKPGNADATRLTAGGLIGTPHYMSPEQAHGELVDARADLYALGCLLFELVTGATPFEGSGFEVLLAHLGRPPPRPSDRNPELPELIDRLVAALMAKRPDDRVQSADTVVELIDEVLDTLDKPTASAATPRPRPRAKRKTARTRKDRPAWPRAVTPVSIDFDAPSEPARAPPSRVRWMALGAVGALALGFAGYTVFHPDAASDASAIDRRPAQHPAETPILSDQGDLRLRVWAPRPLHVGRARIHLELRNKLGALVAADQLIVTLEDPVHDARAVNARKRRAHPDQFGLAFNFQRPGTYHLRVFPPEDEARSPTTFDVELDVVP